MEIKVNELDLFEWNLDDFEELEPLKLEDFPEMYRENEEQL